MTPVVLVGPRLVGLRAYCACHALEVRQVAASIELAAAAVERGEVAGVVVTDPQALGYRAAEILVALIGLAETRAGFGFALDGLPYLTPDQVQAGAEAGAVVLAMRRVRYYQRSQRMVASGVRPGPVVGSRKVKRAEKIRALLEDGKSVREAARLARVAPNTVQKIRRQIRAEGATGS